jgi:hypothetical protein
MRSFLTRFTNTTYRNGHVCPNVQLSPCFDSGTDELSFTKYNTIVTQFYVCRSQFPIIDTGNVTDARICGVGGTRQQLRKWNKYSNDDKYFR